ENPAQRDAFRKWCAESKQLLEKSPSGWIAPEPQVIISTKNTNGIADTTFSILPDHSVLFAGKPGDNIELKLPLSTGSLVSIRLELIPQTLPNGSIMRDQSESIYIPLRARLLRQGQTNETKLAFYASEANHKEER